MDDSDRLSDLNDDVIHGIFSKLEMRDVVRTTVLSKRWVNLWTSLKCLNFAIETVETDGDFIKCVLDRWNGTEIKIFKIRVGKMSPRANDDMRLWITFAVERKVEELQIITPWTPSFYYLSLPKSVYTCSSIRKLTLYGFIKRLTGPRNSILKNVQWDELRTLVIHGHDISEDVIGRVLSGSPKLETLRLCFGVRPETVNIQSSTLKILELACGYRDRLNDTRLRICAPKLRELVFNGPAFRKCVLTDTLSLTNVVLGFTDKRPRLLRETLRQILPAVQHVEVVKLSFQCSKALRVMIDNGSLLSAFSNVKLLDFMCCPNHMRNIFGILEAFLEVERLIIRWHSSYNNPDESSEILEDVAPEQMIPDFKSLESFMINLRTVEIRLREYDGSIFGFIASLLKHATQVRKIVIQMRGGAGEWMYKKLVGKRWASLQSFFPNVKLVFYQV